jgi:hypothetical protein
MIVPARLERFDDSLNQLRNPLPRNRRDR